MKTIEETRRELFSAWFEGLNHRKPELQYGPAGHYYLDQRTEDAWQGFSAALDAVIELPDCTEFDSPSGAAPAIDACRAAILAAGLKVKS